MGGLPRDLKTLKAHGKVESGDQTFTTPKDYLEHKLNDAISGSHLKGTEHQETLRRIYVFEHIDYIGKNLKAIREEKGITIDGHKFDSQTHYLKYEINLKQNDPAHDGNIIYALKKGLDHIEKHQTVENLLKGFEEHERHQNQQKQSQSQTQKTLEKTKDDDFTFTM